MDHQPPGQPPPGIPSQYGLPYPPLHAAPQPVPESPRQRRLRVMLIVGTVVLFIGIQLTVGILSFRSSWLRPGPFFGRAFVVTHAPLTIGSMGVIKNRNNKDVHLTIVGISGNVPANASSGNKQITIRVRFDLTNTDGIVGDWKALGSDLQEYTAENNTFRHSTSNGSTTVETNALFDVPPNVTLKWIRFRVDLVADLYFDAP